jgi:hypothetical protein
MNLQRMRPRRLGLWLWTTVAISVAPAQSGWWTGWQEIPGGGQTFSSGAAAVMNSHFYLFVRGTDDYLYWQKDLTTWAPVPRSVATANPPAAVTFRNAQTFVFALARDGALYYTDIVDLWGPLYPPVWDSRWYNVPPPPSPPARAPAAALFEDTVYLFSVGFDRRVYFATFNGSTWQNWQAVPNSNTDHEVSATAVYSGLHLFARNPVDGSIVENTLVDGGMFGQFWRGWKTVPGGGRSDAGPCAATLFNGQILLFIKGAGNNRIYYTSHNGTQWLNNWPEFPGNGQSFNAPYTTGQAGYRPKVFITGIDNRIYKTEFAPLP